MTITARGPAAAGALPLAEVARLCGEFQSTIERIALGLQGTTTITGRRPKDTVDSVRLLFTGFHEGSAVLELSRPGTQAADGRLLQESLDVLAAGTAAVAAGRPAPEAFTSQVLDGLIRLCGGIGSDAVTEIEITAGARTIARFDERSRQSLRDLRRRVERSDTTIVGVLQMGDFAPSALRCRIETLETSVTCTFDEQLIGQVLAALNTMVVASGVGEFLAGGALRSLDLRDVRTVPRAEDQSFERLAQEQGIQPWTDHDVGSFGSDEPLSDEEFDDFLREALSSRGREGD